jgi:putative selenate reductase
MTDVMAIYPFGDLLQRIFAEYAAEEGICSIPRSSWYMPPAGRKVAVFGQELETPLGPAAGPHTQLAVNIVASYLTGSRFIELKTTQILESLEIAKPCIDAADEGYNTEWSTELSLETAWQEYAKAWVLLHILEAVFEVKGSDLARSFVFNLSVGYDLEGIKTEKMQQYIHRMIDSSDEPLFRRWIDEARKLLPGLLESAGLSSRTTAAFAALEGLSGEICSSVTLSTMHGCPPDEIEAIATHMLSDIGLDCYVKLNPTLLGFDDVRSILDDTGYSYVDLDPQGFARDLSWEDAIPMINRLTALAGDRKRRFGVKLSNTLANHNDGKALPGDERYLSGRALYPVTIELAARIAQAFDGDLPISYSGGIAAWNVRQVFETGIRPVTLATDLLKPGGYFRQLELLRILDDEASPAAWDAAKPDAAAIRRLADQARSAPEYHKDYRSSDQATNPGALPLTDCYVAPCVTACPIRQQVPEYLRLAGEGKWDQAMSVILEDNALPGITGAICDHACQLHCTRLDYEGCVNIREVKHIIEERSPQTPVPERTQGRPREAKTAIIGAGPAGLSAAYFLARDGFPVEVFDRAPGAGGVVRFIVPKFRIPEETITRDIQRIMDLGVIFHFGWSDDIDIEAMRSRGFGRIILALGTWKDRDMDLGSHMPVFGAYDFLGRFNRGDSIDGARGQAIIIGAGDTAMDCARSALRLPGVKGSTVLYRRSKAQMPASREEYELAIEDGVRFYWLHSPDTSPAAGKLNIEEMELGEPDASGRRRPLSTGRFKTIEADFCVSAVGDDPEYAVLEKLGLLDEAGRVSAGDDGSTSVEGVYLIGDSRTGGSSIVNCIAEGRRAAAAVAKREAVMGRKSPLRPDDIQRVQIAEKRGRAIPKPNPRVSYADARFAATEMERCLECNVVCNKCVDVCPNRANIAVAVPGDGFANEQQIVHLDGLCNECGNCGQFCPWDGNPYLDKPTIFSSPEAFEESSNPGWYVEEGRVLLRFRGGLESYSGESAVAEAAAPAAAVAGEKPSESRAHFNALFAHLHRSRPELFSHGNTKGEVPA